MRRVLAVAVVLAAATGVVLLIAAAARADDREKPTRDDELKDLMTSILNRLEKMQETIEKLTAENAELRRALERERAARQELERGRREGEGDQPRASADAERREGAARESGGRPREARREGDGDREASVAREGDRDRVRREGDTEGSRERVAAREGDEGRSRREGEAKAETRSLLRGTFVKLAELKLGELEHLAVVIRAGEGDATVTLYVPMRREGERWVRDERVAGQAKKLKAGQRVVAQWRAGEGEKFLVAVEALTGKDAEAKATDREKAAEGEGKAERER